MSQKDDFSTSPFAACCYKVLVLPTALLPRLGSDLETQLQEEKSTGERERMIFLLFLLLCFFLFVLARTDFLICNMKIMGTPSAPENSWANHQRVRL